MGDSIAAVLATDDVKEGTEGLIRFLTRDIGCVETPWCFSGECLRRPFVINRPISLAPSSLAELDSGPSNAKRTLSRITLYQFLIASLAIRGRAIEDGWNSQQVWMPANMTSWSNSGDERLQNNDLLRACCFPLRITGSWGFGQTTSPVPCVHLCATAAGAKELVRERP